MTAARVELDGRAVTVALSTFLAGDGAGDRRAVRALAVELLELCGGLKSIGTVDVKVGLEPAAPGVLRVTGSVPVRVFVQLPAPGAPAIPAGG